MQIKKIVDQDYIKIDFNTYKTLFYPANSEAKQLQKNIETKLKKKTILRILRFLSWKLPTLLVLITLM